MCPPAWKSRQIIFKVVLFCLPHDRLLCLKLQPLSRYGEHASGLKCCPFRCLILGHAFVSPIPTSLRLHANTIYFDNSDRRVAHRDLDQVLHNLRAGVGAGAAVDGAATEAAAAAAAVHLDLADDTAGASNAADVKAAIAAVAADAERAGVDVSEPMAENLAIAGLVALRDEVERHAAGRAAPEEGATPSDDALDDEGMEFFHDNADIGYLDAMVAPSERFIMLADFVDERSHPDVDTWDGVFTDDPRVNYTDPGVGSEVFCLEAGQEFPLVPARMVRGDLEVSINEMQTPIAACS